jgi:ATP-binding cassette subfamily B (MDR/TAP) protein 1
MASQSGELIKEANLLAGDAIVNFKTVQSFGHEDKIAAKYNELLRPVYETALMGNVKTGFAFGMSQFFMFSSIALMFWGGGYFLSTVEGLNAGDVFSALFAIMFGATAMGEAAAYGPDIGKATAAADKIFKIIDFPSTIDAEATSRDVTKLKVNRETFQGKVEFRDVWFRYPSRKEDFVLRGLNLCINPKESVALVGESGCGKSTFVNLVMRFYDVDAGEVLIDDIDIRDYDLHSLRTVISMVMQDGRRRLAARASAPTATPGSF